MLLIDGDMPVTDIDAPDVHCDFAAVGAYKAELAVSDTESGPSRAHWYFFGLLVMQAFVFLIDRRRTISPVASAVTIYVMMAGTRPTSTFHCESALCLP